MKDGITVVDLFCGAGGFSEGFRQAGFDVLLGLDSWNQAIKTHKRNHPESKHSEIDIRELDTPQKIEDAIPDSDVIVGGPPCVSFSSSNKAGKADKSEGIELIEAFLRIVAWKKHKGCLKYWCMENVPNVLDSIQTEEAYEAEQLGLPPYIDDLEINTIKKFKSENFGVPQRRRRVIVGDYPVPDSAEGREITVKDVFSELKNPLSPEEIDIIQDPLYDVELKKEDLTDHFYDTRVEEYKWKQACRRKVDHGYYGKMSFPEEVDRPSRTVMATRSAATREAMLFDVEGIDEGDGAYRLPTVREIASFMSYPITYQLYGSTESKKFRLVGNSVPPKVSRAIAEEIVAVEGMELESGGFTLPDEMPEKDLTGKERDFRDPPRRRASKKFAWHVPKLKEDAYRAEITNEDSDFENGDIKWRAVLHKGIGKNMETFQTDLESLDAMISERCLEVPGSADNAIEVGDVAAKFDVFVEEIKDRFQDNLPDSRGFHEIYLRRGDYPLLGPHEALSETRKVIDKVLPENKFGGVYLDIDGQIEVDDNRIPLRLFAAYYACQYIVERVGTQGIELPEEDINFT